MLELLAHGKDKTTFERIREKLIPQQLAQRALALAIGKPWADGSNVVQPESHDKAA